MKTIGIIRNMDMAESGENARLLEKYLKEKGAACFISPTGEDLPEDCLFALVLGGDGTLLRAAKAVIDRQLPLLGINLGHLGYLAEVETGSMFAAVDRVLEGNYTIERRMMLEGRLIRDGEVIYEDLALNEIVVNRLGSLRSYVTKNYVNGEFLNSYSADGVIIATATGSTGYNLSAGGPIVAPDAEMILLTPLAAHSLISRSIIFSGSDTITVEIGMGRCGFVTDAAAVRYDGDGNVMLQTDDRVEIRRSERYTNIIKINNISFLEVLRRKMADV